MLNPDLSLTSPYRIEVAQRQRQGPQDKEFGIFFGYGETRTTYFTLTMTNTAEARLEYKDAKNQWNRIQPVTPTPIPRRSPGAINRLAVEARGNELTAFLNGEVLAKGTAPVPIDGPAGLFVDAMGMEVVFSEFRITSLASTTTTKTVPVPPKEMPMTAGGKAIIDDDLTTNPHLTADTDKFCTKTYADGGLKIVAGPTGCEFEAEVLNEVPMRIRLEVSSRLIKGDSIGVVFGQTGRKDGLHYHLLVSVTGKFTVEISRDRKTDPLIPWTDHAAIRTAPGSTNRLAVEVLLQEIRVFINGQFAGSVTSPDIVQGGYGFTLLGDGTTAVFSNLKLIDFSAATTTAATESSTTRAVSVGGKQRPASTGERRGGEPSADRRKGS
jgi:hypothetical protein